MECLYNALKDFQNKEIYLLENLTHEFEKLAEIFLYGGYLSVNTEYQIYIRTVEFYFHDEQNSPNAIKDPIVYHRNERFPNQHVPYFPTMSLHSHTSGFDITFENEQKQYRASALIRSYDIYSIKESKWIVKKDNRSTFLYYYLNGFSLQAPCSIKWKDEAHQVFQLRVSKRRNVFEYNENGEKTNRPDMRQWSFTRDTDIIL